MTTQEKGFVFYEIPDQKEHFDPFGTDAVHYIIMPELSFKDAGQRAFLDKIIKAVGLEASQEVSIQSVPAGSCVHFGNHPMERSVKLILFGFSDFTFALQFPPKVHHVYQLGMLRILFAESLDQYQQDAPKKLLWHALKVLYPPV